jgi:hypothetical protein
MLMGMTMGSGRSVKEGASASGPLWGIDVQLGPPCWSLMKNHTHHTWVRLNGVALVHVNGTELFLMNVDPLHKGSCMAVACDNTVDTGTYEHEVCRWVCYSD